MRQNNVKETSVNGSLSLKLEILLLVAKVTFIVLIITSCMIGYQTVRYTKSRLQPFPLLSSYVSEKTFNNVETLKATVYWDEFYRKIRSILKKSVLIRVYKQNVTVADIRFPQSNIVENGCKNNIPLALQSQKRCAIVGSGGILLNSSCGSEIDEHDFVIRINLASVIGFENDVGRKTNLTSINAVVVRNILRETEGEGTKQKSLKFQSHLHRIKHLEGSIIWYSLKSLGIKNKMQLMVKELKAQGMRFALAYSPGDIRGMTKRLWGVKDLPSAGIIVFTAASSFCDHISLYGFYPFYEDPITNETLPYHYYDRRSTNFTRSRHDMPEEYQLFKELNSTGQIRLVTTCAKKR